jgi:hypothetical protein
VDVTSIPAGLVTMACRGGAYTDEATQQSKTLQPHLELRAATIYSGTGRDWVVILSVVKRDFTNSPTYKCVKYIINIAFDRYENKLNINI